MFEDSVVPSGDAAHHGDAKAEILFQAYQSLALLGARVQDQIYTPQSFRKSTAAVAEKTIFSLEKRLDSWRNALPKELSIDNLDQDDQDKEWYRQRIDLAFRYNNIMLLVHFPTFTWAAAQPDKESAKHGAKRCLDAAQDILDILEKFTPPEGSPPSDNCLVWWCIQHYACAAEAIKMLHMVQQIKSGRGVPQAELSAARRPLEWLRQTSVTDLAAKRAFLQLSGMLDTIESLNQAQNPGLQTVTTGQGWIPPDAHTVPEQSEGLDINVNSRVLMEFDDGGTQVHGFGPYGSTQGQGEIG